MGRKVKSIGVSLKADKYAFSASDDLYALPTRSQRYAENLRKQQIKIRSDCGE